MQNMRVRQVSEDFVRVHSDNRTVSHVALLLTGTSVIFPSIESGAEEGFHVAAPGTFVLGRVIHKKVATFVVTEIKWDVTELAHTGRSSADLALFIDYGFVVLSRGGGKIKSRPAVLHGKHGGKMVLDQMCSQLGFKRVNAHLGMSVQEPVNGVAAILVHG